MARKSTKRPASALTTFGTPTPGRAEKAPAVESVPTEAAGVKTSRVVGMVEHLHQKGVIDDRQAAAGAYFAKCAERAIQSTMGQSPLARMDLPAASRNKVDYSLSERQIQQTRRYSKLREELGDVAGLVEAVTVWELRPVKNWHIAKLRLALDEIARRHLPEPGAAKMRVSAP